MNGAKRNYNGWILCPSKRFPSKFYYFNVLTGEAAWSLNELEQTTMTKSSLIQRADKWHSYPEPGSPPTEDWTFKRFPGFGTSIQTPMFGQVMFPKYPTNIDNYNSGIVWTPSQMRPVSSNQMGHLTNQMGPISNQMGHMSNQMGHMSNQMGPICNQMGLMTNQMNLAPMLQMSSMSSQIPQVSIPQMSLPAAQLTQIPSMGVPLYVPYSEMPNLTVPNPGFWPQEPTFPTQPKRAVWVDKTQNQKPNQNLFGNSDIKQWSFDKKRIILPSKLTTQRLAEHNECFENYQHDKLKNFVRKVENHEFLEQQNKRVFEKPIQTRESQDIIKIKRTVNFGTVKPALERKRTLSEGHSTDNEKLINSKSADNLNNTCFGTNLQRKTPNFSQTQNLTQNVDNRHSNIRRSLSKSTENIIFNDEPSFSDTSNSISKLRLDFDKPRTPEALRKNPFAPKSHDKGTEIESRDSSPAAKRIKPPTIDDNVDLIMRSKSFENLSILDDETLVEDRLKNKKSEIQIASKNNNVKTKDENVLDKNDLRFTLLAKRQKTVVKGEQANRDGEAKKMIKTYKEETKPESNRKRKVRFNLEEEIQEPPEQDFESVPEVEEPRHPDLSISGLRALGRLSDGAQWYIVVDTDVLLHHIHFLGATLQNDPTCILLIPDAVRRETECLSRGDHRGRQLVLLARNLARKLANPPKFIVFQIPDVEEMMTDRPVTDSIINCCLLMINESHHVVLITNDEVLYQKATDSEIYTFTIQEIQDGASSENPEVSFQFKKIPNADESKEKDYKMADKGEMAPKNHSFPVNCFRKGLFDGSASIDDTKKISPQNTESSKPIVIQKNTITSTLDGNRFPPRQRESEESSDLTLSSDVRREIQKLNLKETPRRLEIQKNVSLKTATINLDNIGSKVFRQTLNEQEYSQPENQNSQKENVTSSQNSQKENVTSTASLIKKIKRINPYTIEAQLKSFNVKNEIAEERISLRLEEWLCSFTQIMEDALTEILEPTFNPETQNLPPWDLPEALECTAEVFGDGDNSPVRLLSDKLLEIIVRHLTDKGQPKESLTPHIFMKMLGCGTLLIKCLNRIQNDTELIQAEDSLLEILQAIEEPVGSDDNLPVLIASKIDMEDVDYEPRKNFIKKSSEVIEYLKQHFSAWRNYENTTTFPPTKVVRTCGKDINLLRIDRNKDITMKTNNNDNNNQNIDQKDIEDTKNVAETGTKLLKRLAMSSLGKFKEPIMKEIDIEKRETVNQKMADMISDMTGQKTITKFYDLNTVIVNESTYATCDEKHIESAESNREAEKLKIIRKIEAIAKHNNSRNVIKTNLETKQGAFDKSRTDEYIVPIEGKEKNKTKNVNIYTKNKEDKKNEEKHLKLPEMLTKNKETSKNEERYQKLAEILTKNKENPKNEESHQKFAEILTKYKGNPKNEERHIKFATILTKNKENPKNEERHQRLAEFLTNDKENPRDGDITRDFSETYTEYAEKEPESEINNTKYVEKEAENEINGHAKSNIFDLDALDYNMMENDSDDALTSSDDNRLMIVDDEFDYDRSDHMTILEPRSNGFETVIKNDDDSRINKDTKYKSRMNENEFGIHENIFQKHKNKSQNLDNGSEKNRSQKQENGSEINENGCELIEDRSEIHDNKSETYENRSKNHENRSQIQENVLQINKNSSQKSQSKVNVAETNEKDAEIEAKESQRNNESKAYIGFKIFFVELGECLVNTLNFVEHFLSATHEKTTEEQRMKMSEIVGDVWNFFGCLIEKLECIIKREKNKELLKSIIQSNKDAADDWRVLHHGKVMEKCTEQSKIIMTQLDTLMDLSVCVFDMSSPTEAVSGRSAILPFTDHSAADHATADHATADQASGP